MSHTGNLKTSTMYNRKLSENGLVKDLSAINLFSTLLGLPGFTTWTPSESLFADPALQPLMNLILPHPKSAEYCMLRPHALYSLRGATRLCGRQGCGRQGCGRQGCGRPGILFFFNPVEPEASAKRAAVRVK